MKFTFDALFPSRAVKATKELAKQNSTGCIGSLLQCVLPGTWELPSLLGQPSSKVAKPAVASKSCSALPELRVRVADTEAGHRQFGVVMGKHFRDRIRVTFEEDAELRKFMKSKVVVPLLDAMMQFHQGAYPLLWAEVEGIAEGSGLPLKEVAAASFRQELETAAGEEVSEACTDIYCSGRGILAFGHNEDYGAVFADRLYLVTAEIGDQRGKPYTFSAMTFPGVLPGWGPSVTSKGLGMTMNVTMPTRAQPALVDEQLVAVTFACRDMVSGRTVDEVMQLAAPRGLRLGMNLNVGGTWDQKMLSVEIGPGGTTDVKCLEQWSPETTSFGHTNHYNRLQITQDPPSLSSERRLMRYEQMANQVQSVHDIFAVLGDAHDNEKPIFCAPKPAGKQRNCLTLATWGFNFTEGVAQVWVHDHSKGLPWLPSPQYWESPTLSIQIPRPVPGSNDTGKTA